MGTDAHLHVEIKVHGKWMHWTQARPRRDYRMFAKMADVRNDHRAVRPIAAPRGLPIDATPTTLWDRERWGVDGHSESWLSWDEIRELAAFFYGAVGSQRSIDGNWFAGSASFEGWLAGSASFTPGIYLFGDGWDEHESLEDVRESATRLGFEDVRFVFWFDN